MQQPTSRQLYAYWDRVRNGRIAPRRFEIEPAKSAALLPETFIAEGVGPLGHRFRLAGTRICEQFGRELRGADLLSLWEDADRDAVAALLRTVFADAAVGYGRFKAYTHTNRQASFEFVLLPTASPAASARATPCPPYRSQRDDRRRDMRPLGRGNTICSRIS